MVQTIAKTVDKILSVFAGFFVLTFCLIVLLQIICRALPFLPIPSWTEELARYCFIYAIACAAGLAARGNAFIAVDILTNLIPRKFKRIYTICLNIVLCAFAVFFEARCAARFAFLRTRMVSTAMEIPMQWVYFALVVLFGMLSIMYFLEVLLLFRGEKVKEGVTQ
ncbi:MAG: TRAP transporter small permease [Treponema sp.]|jgi:TRAP-type C4-dicarboxylate transport system permease small subunit|nr:TRAP transporter small permease [Treponema sp.]